MTAVVQLVALVLEATSPADVGRFWSRALGWEWERLGAAVRLRPSDATSFELLVVPGAREKVGQNRIHLDLTTTSLDDQRDLVAALLDAGGSHVDIGQDSEESHVVLADPDGNELCVIEPTNRFLAGCPRLGAVNCDGTAALGRFYRAALAWPLVWDQDEETAIQAPDGTGPKITWSGLPLMPRSGRERFHLHLAPMGGNVDEVIDGLLALGATRRAGDGCEGAVALADVDGNPICMVS